MNLCAFFLAECFLHYSVSLSIILGWVSSLASLSCPACFRSCAHSGNYMHAHTRSVGSVQYSRSYHTRTTSEWTMPEAFVRRVISGFPRSARYHGHFSSSAAVSAFHCCQATTGGLLLSLASLSWTASRDFHFFLSPCVEHQPGHHLSLIHI